MTDHSYTLEEVVAILRLSRTKIKRYCNAGRFPHLRYGQEIRFTPAHLAEIQAGAEHGVKPAEEQADPWGRRGRQAS